MDLVTKRKWDNAALAYDIMNGFGPEKRWAPFKRRLFSLMWGKVLFAAVGTGQDIQFFPPGQDIVGIDISDRMLAIAQPRAEAYPADSSSDIWTSRSLTIRITPSTRRLRPVPSVRSESGRWARLRPTCAQTWRPTTHVRAHR